MIALNFTLGFIVTIPPSIEDALNKDSEIIPPANCPAKLVCTVLVVAIIYLFYFRVLTHY